MNKAKSMGQERLQAPSTELTGGAGFTFEDTVVAYYLTGLLLNGHAAGSEGRVTSVAMQRKGHDQPMDDLVVEFVDLDGTRTLSLQIKTSLRISAAKKNDDFRSVIAKALATRALPSFKSGRDVYGFAVENVTNAKKLRSLERLIKWANADATPADFARRFESGGAAADAERTLRSELLSLTKLGLEAEVDFLKHFVAIKLEGLESSAPLRAATITQLQSALAENRDGEEILLFDRLRTLVRDGSAVAKKWFRADLLAQLSGVIRLKTVPSYRPDIEKLQALSREALVDVSEKVGDFHVSRPELHRKVQQALELHRLVNLSGLPGCGKSAVLKGQAEAALERGTILFLKSDRLIGNGWTAFAAALGLEHSAADLLAEISASGTSILFIDGIDRVRPDQKGVITDLLRTIETTPALQDWQVLATARDQGLEPYRAWVPASFHREAGIGDISVGPFSPDEAETLAMERPQLRPLLFGPQAIQQIARRPFFASILVTAIPEGQAPQTEIDLINAWWARAGHDAIPADAVQRQRALVDLAECGVGTLGKGTSVRLLKEGTVGQLVGLAADRIIREEDGGARYSFTHDIFFEWAFYRILIEMGDDWPDAIARAGEPPLLGRVVALLAQQALLSSGKWASTYPRLEALPLRSQWRREWLTSPPFSSAFAGAADEFTELLIANDYRLLEKVLVWFQAQHTVPSPMILSQNNAFGDGQDKLRLADMLGWPSDFQGWSRLLDWLLPIAADLPVRLRPSVLELLNVWQNTFSDLRHPRSKGIVELCEKWLLSMEAGEYGQDMPVFNGEWRVLGRDARSNFETALRTSIIRACRAFPAPAKALYDRAVQNDRMRRDAFSDLMGFAPLMVPLSPEHVIAVAKAEIMEELPQERADRLEREETERASWLARLRAIPADQRTPQQKRALESSGHFFIGSERYELDDIGIDRHGNGFFPVSALHEPFKSLFAHAPDHGLALVRDLSNHAVKGWRQIHNIRRDLGTPLPVTLQFPWGEQEFWGDWPVFSWSLGELGPQPLECAYLALRYWAFKEIENGQTASAVIRRVLEGSECYAHLGLALTLALETFEVSDTTLPLVSCQRLWRHDEARVRNEPLKGIDLFGFGALSRLTGDKAAAKDFLDSRESTKRGVEQLAMMFALSGEETLQEACKQNLARFPGELPYEFEEHREVPNIAEQMSEDAVRWAGLGNVENYRRYKHTEDQDVIAYQPPMPRTAAQEARRKEATTWLGEQHFLTWATKSLSESKLAEGATLSDAVRFAREADTPEMFKVRQDVGPHARQSAISAIAACVICFDQVVPDDLDWAWDVLGRVERMAEPGDFHGSRIPWHPALHLAAALFHDRRGQQPRLDSAGRLMALCVHPLEEVSLLAFYALFQDSDLLLTWVAAGLALDLSFYRSAKIDEDGTRDNSSDRKARIRSLKAAQTRWDKRECKPLKTLPPAWKKFISTKKWEKGREVWRDPDPLFDAQTAAKIFKQFPIDRWGQSGTYGTLFASALEQMVDWTAQRIMPSWHDPKDRKGRGANLYEWLTELSDMIARTVPFYEESWIRDRLLTPFFPHDDDALHVIANFTDMAIRRHVLDARDIPEGVFGLLDTCLDRVIGDPTFDPLSYRAGEVSGHHMPDMIRALTFTAAQNAPGSARFANGDWSQINTVMPLVEKLVSNVGWSASVMESYLKLCERVGDDYPVDDFARQINAALTALLSARASWTGTMLPARIASMVQRLSDANFPLNPEQALELLRILDGLVDLGDRRSAALEQSEVFRFAQTRETRPERR